MAWHPQVSWKVPATILIMGLLTIVWGLTGISLTIYNRFIADSAPFMDYDWMEVMSRQILIFALGWVLFALSWIIYLLNSDPLD